MPVSLLIWPLPAVCLVLDRLPTVSACLVPVLVLVAGTTIAQVGQRLTRRESR